MGGLSENVRIAFMPGRNVITEMFSFLKWGVSAEKKHKKLFSFVPFLRKLLNGALSIEAGGNRC